MVDDGGFFCLAAYGWNGELGMRAILIVGLALGMGGCATVTRGTTEEVQFISQPSGARVTTSAGQGCTTPCSLTFSRKTEFVATFKLPGYRTEKVHVRTKFGQAGAATAVGNLVVPGGSVGLLADTANGANLDHRPNPVSVTMQRGGGVRMSDPAAQAAAEPAG